MSRRGASIAASSSFDMARRADNAVVEEVNAMPNVLRRIEHQFLRF
jgi:hypothetical protein